MHPTHRDDRPRRSGFTLTELLVVIALIVLLVALLLAALGQVQEKAKQTTTSATMSREAPPFGLAGMASGMVDGLAPSVMSLMSVGGSALG